MPLPPILEVFVVWHPDDELGEFTARTLIRHFHSSVFSGLSGGAVEVYVRSQGWAISGGSPRPLPSQTPQPYGLLPAQFTAVVPVLGTGMARAVRDDRSWHDYIQTLVSRDRQGGVGVYPLRDPEADIRPSSLQRMTHHIQALPAASARDEATLCRELARAVAQRLAEGEGREKERIKIFVSHTKHSSLDEQQQEEGQELFAEVKRVIQETRLHGFFDATDLDAGDDWQSILDAESGRGALLMVRTDRYSGREWTQREVHTAKKNDLPIVTLYALRFGEDRGSFLMDHVPAVPCDFDNPTPDITRALDRIIDECLKRSLWRAQSVYLERDGFHWLPVHAPEPVTATPWLIRHRARHGSNDRIWVIHPDPPLGTVERDVIIELFALAGFTAGVDVWTPRTFSARGGEVSRDES